MAYSGTRMADSSASLNWSEDRALRAILEGTAVETGTPFFDALVKNLSLATLWRDSWVSEYLPERDSLRSLAFWSDDKIHPNVEYPLTGTPCEIAVREQTLVHYSNDVQTLFPDDVGLQVFDAKSYLGVPLTDDNGQVIGHLAMINNTPSPKEPRGVALFNIFASRAAAELKRMRAEAAHREIEQQLSSVFNCALDAIVTVNADLEIVLVNAAAERLFNCAESDLLKDGLSTFLADEDTTRLRQLVGELGEDTQPEPYLWVPGKLAAHCKAGRKFPAEATLSRCELAGQMHFIIILRDIAPRLAAEARIQELGHRTQYLEEEIRALQNVDGIIGNSPALQHALEDVRQVAGTDASVLVLGETGTGKELFAHAIHDASTRSHKPLVKVNCAALPSALIESELFGHEKGAFTGATSKRVGRFSLADGGTMFLDEVGELPLELQAKLLRVLQEGEFEPVGSSQTFKVDVRIITATNRDLAEAVANGEFREDLYYRINVFPITIPPLRDRSADIAALAQSFLQRFAQRAGRELASLSADDIRMLTTYRWPGNVRELENVLERAVITAVNGCANLKRALPDLTSDDHAGATVAASVETRAGDIMTNEQIQSLERDNIRSALDQSDWRIAGPKGAAELLGMKPSTLSSRVKSLGLTRS